MELKKELDKLDKEFEKRKKELEERYLMEKGDGLNPEAKELARFLHKKMCTYNHTDGCGWEYESGWAGYAHKRYYDKAVRALNHADKNTIIKVIEAIYGR